MRAHASFDTVIFDIIGTVVDEHGSVLSETTEVLARNGSPDAATSARLSAEWTARLDRAVGDIAAERAQWESNDVLRSRTLNAAIDSLAAVHIEGSDREHLARLGHRLRPWPDSAPALCDLRKAFTVVALSNGDLAQLAHFSAAGGLSWHCVLSGSAVKSAKPNAVVYQLAIDTLQLDPGRTLFVACHPWDLRAAALHGFRTAYVHRPGEVQPTESDRFDLIATDLADLVQQLIR